MSDRALGQVYDLPPLPPFASAQELLTDALPLLDAPSRMTPTEAAQRYVRVETRGVWQNYDPEVTPYMVEPVDTTKSRIYKAGAFVGPSQSGKTMALITTALHPVTCDPAPALVVHMDRPSRDRWVEESLNPVIQNSPDVRDRLGRGRDDDTFMRKRFRGMRLMLGYPTPQWLSSAKYRFVGMTDYDHFPPELGVRKDAPEGSAFDMGLQRIKSFMSRGFLFAESTPAWPVIKPDWSRRKDAPHELPPVRYGIVPLYNRGTRGRWYWECRDCGELFEPRFDRLHFDPDLPPVEAGEAAEMACPHCGSLIGSQHRNEFNRAGLKGRGGWFHEAETGGGIVPLGDARIRGSEIASWALNGAAATFSSWSSMVTRYLDAQREAEEMDDDLALGRFMYTEVGLPYSRSGDEEDGDLTVKSLKAKRQERPRGVAPAWVRFITVSIDVQGTYFTVQVTGWGIDGSRTVLDRFDLTQPPVDADGAAPKRKLDPGKYPGDWDVLAPLDHQLWQVEGADCALRAVTLGVDFQGAPGVSDNAEEFWRKRSKAGQGSRWFLTRGHGGFNQRDRVWHEAPERSNKNNKGRRIKLLNMATDRLKDSVAAALGRPLGDRRSFPLPEFLSEDHLGEFCAEERLEKGWALKKGQKRNESFDLSVQAQAMAEHKGLRRINQEAPPNWATLGEGNPHWVAGAHVPETPDQPAPKPKRRKRRVGKMRV
ncbi:phage terminase large subunit family protein [Leisingera sp. S132]|uniref:phage terminase large subunit family protein n=1 Tax=Leisingera sp. S132 TaxID=2867016 RepID=UPI0021A45B25|nr:phage terminase large subunit family protein [Leisingera sp. S132]UWQ77616.1 phage terminase large subunit family protein [Leisingera sp. S132]